MTKINWYKELDRITTLQMGCGHMGLDLCWRWESYYNNDKTPMESFKSWQRAREDTWLYEMALRNRK